LGTMTVPPYIYYWTNVPAGTYSLSAKVTDNLGAVATTAPISVTVPKVTSPVLSTVATFYKGINLGGSAVTIDGNQWISYADALANGLAATNASGWAGTYSFATNPTTDSGTLSMLQSTAWRSNATNGTGLSLAQTLPNGDYQVYVWAIENYQSNFRNMDVKLEGVTVAQAIGDLPLGSWKKYGPFTTTIKDGVLNIDVLRNSKGDPGLAGIAIYSLK